MYTATFDVGTTALKAVVVTDRGEAVFSGSQELHTIENGSFREQDPEEWYQVFCRLSGEILERVPSDGLRAVILSGQMQDVIPVDSQGKAIGNAILYSDGRAKQEARDICSLLPGGETRAAQITGNHLDGSMPLAKIRWLMNHKRACYERAACFLISSKDYIIGRLTGSFVGNVTACSTAGLMDLEKKCWSRELAAAAGLDPEKLPRLLRSHELAGRVTVQGAADTGYPAGLKVYAGVGDAGAATLASGILRPGEYNIHLGTSSWVAAVSDGFMDAQDGGFNLASMETGTYINVVPFLNGGNVHRFLGRLLSREHGRPDYEYLSMLLAESVPGSHGLFCLPYLTGERFPVMDGEVRGGFLGLGQETSAADLVRSALEGVACSIRQGLERFLVPPEKITLIGGGAREEAWCRIISSVIGRPVYVYQEPERLPALALASAVHLAEGLIESYEAFVSALEAEDGCMKIDPEPGTKRIYDEIYGKYRRLYPMVKEFFREGQPEEKSVCKVDGGP